MQGELEKWDIDALVAACGRGIDCDEKISQELRRKMDNLQVRDDV